MKNLNSIIKKILKEQKEELLYAPEVRIVNKSGEYESSFNTFTNPNGRSILVPKDLDPYVEVYDKQKWLDWVTSTSSLRKQYSTYLSANDDIYAKSCNDEYFKALITEFDKVSKDYIEILDFNPAQYKYDEVSKNYVEILDSKVTKYWPSDLNTEEGLHYYYFLSRKSSNPNYTIKPIDFKGFDYYFKKMSEWLKQSQWKDDVSIEKGLGSIKHNFSVAKYNGATEKIPDGWIPPWDVNMYDGTIQPKEKFMLDWWDWSISRNKYCETEGSWINYYNSQISFATMLPDTAAYSISVLTENLYKYYNQKEGAQPLNFNPDPNDKSRVLFVACYKTTMNTDSSILKSFADYYSKSNDWNAANIKNKVAGDCSGIKFPSMASILDANNINVLDESGKLMTYAESSVISIPLYDLNVNFKGKVFKGQTSRVKSAEKGRDWFWLGDEGGRDFRDDLGAFVTYAWDNLASTVTFWDQSDDMDPIKNLASNLSGTEPSLFQTKESFAMKTPLNAITKGLFNSTDYIDTTKINEDTEVWQIPEEGLSQYIPGAIKPKKYDAISPNGTKPFDYYYLKYSNPLNNINAMLPLPPASFWSEYSEYYYKFRNSVIADNWLNKTYPEFGLVLTIVGAENFRLVQETKGKTGWSLKIDNNTGGMYFGEKNSETGLNINFKTDLTTGESNIYFNGFDDKKNTWGAPLVFDTYNFYNKEYFDDRSKFDSFWDSHWGLISQVLVGIAITIVAPYLSGGIAVGMGWTVETVVAGSLGEWFITTGAFNVSRLAVTVEIIMDLSILGAPGAISYWHRGETIAGWFSLLCSMIPFVTSKTSFQGWSKKIWLPSVAKSLTKRIIDMGPNYFGPNFNIYRLFAFLQPLSRAEAAAFGDLMQKLASKEASQLIEETFKYSGDYIALAIKESPEIQKRIAAKFEHKTLRFFKPLVAVAGTIFISQMSIQLLVNYFSQKGIELDKKQQENLTIGLNKLYEKLVTGSNKELQKVLNEIRTLNANLVITPTDEWLLNQMKENIDLFNKMLVINGWEAVAPEVEDKKKKEQEEEVEKYKELLLFIEDEKLIRSIPSYVFKNIKGDILDKSLVNDKLNIITSQYPCILNDVDFIFDSAYKLTDTSRWWVSYKILTTNIKDSLIYFIGNGESLINDGYMSAIKAGIYHPKYNNEFNTNFTDCISYRIIKPINSKYMYKKEYKTDKLFKSLKTKESWVEVSDETAKQEILKNYFTE